jgi:hypothetical protein
MRALAFVLIFFTVFAGALVASAPLPPLLQLAGLEARGLAYERATGSVWRGEVAGLRVGPERLGDVRLALEPQALLTGRVRARFEAAGALRAYGDAEYAPGRGWLIEDATFAVSMTDLGRLHPELKDRGGEFHADLARAEVDAQGSCVSAQGEARTDVLTHAGEATLVGAWRGPALEGAIGCEGGDLVVRLDGADASARVAVEARIDLRTGSTFLATVETEDPGVRLALGALGFAEQDGAFAYTIDTAFTDG